MCLVKQNEIPPISVIIGGGIIIFSILLQTFYGKKIKREN